MITKLLASLSFFVLGLAAVQVSTTSHAQSTQTPASNAQAPADTESGGSAEFDLNLAGIGSQSELQRFADEWRAARAKEGLIYGIQVQAAQIKAKPGSNDYGDAFFAALDDAALSAHSKRASELVSNDIKSSLRSVASDRRGFEAKAKEQECQNRNSAKIDAKLKVVANQLAAKAIESLGGINDKSTDFAEGVRCEYEKLVSEFARSISVTNRSFIIGARTLKLAVDGNTVTLAMAYGNAGGELANMLRASKPADKPNPNVRNEISQWVENNMLATPEVLLSSGVRSFKLSNGEWVVVSLGISGLPNQGNMSSTALAYRNQFAVERAQVLALDGLNRFAGATVSTDIKLEDIARFAEMFEVEVKDGISSAEFEQSRFEGEFKRLITSKSQMQLRSPMMVKSGARKSELSQGNVAYAVQAWAPSLVSEARAFDASMKKSSANTNPADSSRGNDQSQRGRSKNMKEDW
jgi:hypothetical protein